MLNAYDKLLKVKTMVDTSNRNRKQLSDIKDISANLVGTDCTTIESFAKVFHSFEAVTNYLKKNANGEFGIALANVGKDLFETLEKLWTLIKLKQGSAVLLNPSEKEICETVIKTVKLMTSDDHLKKMNVIGSPELPIPASITKESLILKLDSIDCMAFESILEFNRFVSFLYSNI